MCVSTCQHIVRRILHACIYIYPNLCALSTVCISEPMCISVYLTDHYGYSASLCIALHLCMCVLSNHGVDSTVST